MAKKISDFDVRTLGYIMQEVGIDRHTSQDVRKAFICSVGRIALRHFRELDAIDPNFVDWNGETIVIGGHHDPEHRRLTKDRLRAHQRAAYFVRRYGSMTRHIVDWLQVAVQHDHAWLKNVDDRGRPKKLLKSGSIRDLFVEAEKQLTRVAQQHSSRTAQVDAHSALKSTDIKWTLSLGDDLHLVQLLSADALDEETAAMGHCIGLGAYDVRVEGDQRRWSYWSVRNDDGVPLATLEVREDVVRQFCGRGNTAPSQAVRTAVETNMEALGWSHPALDAFDVTAWQVRMGYQTDYWRLLRHLGRPTSVEDIRRFAGLHEDDKRIIVGRLRAEAGIAPDAEVPRINDPVMEILHDGDDWVEQVVEEPQAPDAAPGPR